MKLDTILYSGLSVICAAGGEEILYKVADQVINHAYNANPEGLGMLAVSGVMGLGLGAVTAAAAYNEHKESTEAGN